MAALVFSNSVILPSSRISFSSSTSHLPLTHLPKNKRNLHFPTSTHCSLVDAMETKQNIPIETKQNIPIEFGYPAFPTVFDSEQICQVIPHRFPFLLVDRVIEYIPGVSAVGIKNVSINDNFFPGHFPDRPIMPGVLIVEAMAQVGCMVVLQPEVGGLQSTFAFSGIDKLRFWKPVIVGDTLVVRMTLTKLHKHFRIAKMEGTAYVGGEVVCEAEFSTYLG